MKVKITCLLLYLAALPLFVFAKDDKQDIPPIQDSWNNSNADGNRSQPCLPSLFKDANHLYVYSEKQLDNLTIGITDMQGNTYHYEVTTVPACTYYAVSIDSLPSGQYYLCVYQGSNLDITSLLSSEELANISSTHEKY